MTTTQSFPRTDGAGSAIDSAPAPDGMIKGLTRLARHFGYVVSFVTPKQMAFGSLGADGATRHLERQIWLVDTIKPYGATTADVLTHEVAHAMRHCLTPYDELVRMNGAQIEIEAEAIAEIVTQNFGIDHSEAHARYIWDAGMFLPVGRLEEYAESDTVAIIAGSIVAAIKDPSIVKSMPRGHRRKIPARYL